MSVDLSLLPGILRTWSNIWAKRRLAQIPGNRLAWAAEDVAMNCDKFLRQGVEPSEPSVFPSVKWDVAPVCSEGGMSPRPPGLARWRSLGEGGGPPASTVALPASAKTILVTLPSKSSPPGCAKPTGQWFRISWL